MGGVEIPGTEGRAGMVAIPDPDRNVKVDKLYEGLCKMLPVYARPIFIRLVDKIDVTATYKLKKRDLQSQGFNPELVGGGVLMLDSKQQQYLPSVRSSTTTSSTGTCGSRHSDTVTCSANSHCNKYV